MSTPQDMAQCQVRDDQGNPIQIFGPHSRGNYHNHEDNSVNKALPWVAVACIMAGLALGVALMLAPVTDAKIEKAKAEIRAEVAQQIADARADARQARDDAAIWKNRVGRIEAKLEVQK